VSLSKVYASEKELKKLSSYIIFDEETGDIKRVVFPNGMQIGLAAEPFSSGTFNVSGTIESSLGISGSLTRLVDGRSYLSAGTNVTITSESNGQITITAAGGSGSPGGSDTQLQYNNGGAFGGISAFTWDDTDLLVGTTTKLQFRDSGLFVHSPDDGYLVFDSDTRLAITGSGAAANAISLITDNAAGGIDIDSGTGGYQNTSTGKIHLTSSLNSGDGNAIQMLASAGGIQIDAVGTAGEDITIKNTGGSINLSATETSADAINIDSSGGIDIDAAEIVDIDAGVLQIDTVGVTTINSGGTLSLGTANSGVAVSIGHSTSETTVNDNLTVTGDVSISEKIIHTGDTDTFIQFADDAIGITAGGEQLITISEAGQDIVKIGDGGDVDFQVRTNGDDNTLFVQGSSDRVGIGTNTPGATLGVRGVVSASLGYSGSLTRLTDGTSYLAAGSNITITSASNGQVTIASSGGSGGISWDGSTVDGIATFKDADEATVQSNLRFNGSALHLTGALNVKYVSTDDSQNGYSVATTDYIVGVNTSAGAVTTTLPGAATAGAGRLLIIKDIGGYASASAKAINIVTNGSEKIDGADSLQILVSSGTVSLFSDGSNWYVNGVA